MSRSPKRPHVAFRTPVAMDDPVPSGSSVAIVAPDRVDVQPHAIETAVRRKLSCQEGVHFLELVVRRVSDGVCLEGVMQSEVGCPDIAEVVRGIAGVERVINHLLILPPCADANETEEEVASAM